MRMNEFYEFQIIYNVHAREAENKVAFKKIHSYHPKS